MKASAAEVVSGSTPLDVGDFMLMEIAYMPTNAVAEINPIHTAVTINWERSRCLTMQDILSLSDIIPWQGTRTANTPRTVVQQ